MPKKSKRSSYRPTTVTPTKAAGPVTQSAPSIPTPSTQRSSLTVEFNPDYTPIIQDLKKIGILAGILTGILIVLSFIIK